MKLKLYSISLNPRVVVLACACLLAAITTFAQTHYYIRTDTLNAGAKLSLTSRSAWTTNPSGQGSLATRPPATNTFTADNLIFHIQASGYTTSGTWRVTGANSKIIVGADTAVTFSTGNILIGKFDVLDKATLTYSASRTDSLSFGTLAVGSTVRYAGSTIAPQNIVAANYYNLDCNQSSSNALPQVLPAGEVGVAGTFTRESASVPTNINRGTINFNGSGGQVIPNFAYYNLKISGNKSVPDTLRGTAINVSGKFEPIATGAGYIATGTTINFNGLAKQTIPAFNYNSITNPSTGPLMYLKAFDYNAKTLTLFTANPDVTPGLKFTTSTLTFDTTTTSVNTVTAVNGEVITVNNAPKYKIYIKKPGATTLDSTYETAFSIVDSSITVENATNIAVGDTIRGVGNLHLHGATTAQNYALAYRITGKVITLIRVVSNSSNPFINPYVGFIIFSSADGNAAERVVNGNISVAGSFTTGGAKFDCSGSTITFNGKRQTVTGLPYENLIIDQDSATTASLSTLYPTSVSGTLTLRKGRLTTNNTTRKLTLGVNADIKTESDTAFINGPVYKQTASTAKVTLALGKESSTTGIGVGRKVTLEPQTANPKTYVLEFFNAKALRRATPQAPLSFVDSVFFTVNMASGTDSSAKLGFEYQFPIDVDTTLITTAYFDVTDSLWKSYAQKSFVIPITGSGSTAGFITTSDYISNFGRFAPGILTDPLPAVLEYFKATSNNGVNVSWKVATQTNVHYYVVEKSVDGKNYSVVANYPATSGLFYQFNDVNQTTRLTYYRLKIVDNDGSYSYSSVRTVYSILQKQMVVYPNPATKNITINLPKTLGTSVIRIYANNGIMVKELKLAEGSTQTSLDISNFAQGTYTVKYVNGATIYTTRISKL